MYKVSDGFNLRENDGTYFDKHNIMDILHASRSASSTQVDLTNPKKLLLTDRLEKQSKKALKIIQKKTKEHYASQRGEVNSDSQISVSLLTTPPKHFNDKYRNMLDRATGQRGSLDINSLTLEDRILFGAYKP